MAKRAEEEVMALHPVPSFVTPQPFWHGSRLGRQSLKPAVLLCVTGMTGVGFEPTTYGLKVRCSAS